MYEVCCDLNKTSQTDCVRMTEVQPSISTQTVLSFCDTYTLAIAHIPVEDIVIYVYSVEV